MTVVLLSVGLPPVKVYYFCSYYRKPLLLSQKVQVASCHIEGFQNLEMVKIFRIFHRTVSSSFL
jgi:hypothetical protein